uniref:ABC2_membrane domain-containing protein n=1 Tax=Macrostomum lignano TaxID=282301 RepID=A0A1I8FCD1_9PLAT
EPAVEPDPDAQKDQSNAIAQHLVNEWRRSQLARSIERSTTGGGSGSVQTRQLSRRAYPTGFGNQLLHVSWRTWLNCSAIPELALAPCSSRLDTSLESGIQNRQGLFFFLTLQMVFVNLSAVEVFIKRACSLYTREFFGILQCAGVLFGQDSVRHAAHQDSAGAALFMPIIYFMAQLRLEAGAFLFYQLNLVLATCAACGVAFFVSASVSVFGIANILISIMYVFMMVFGGFLINIASVGWLSWCRYLSVFYYAYAGLSVNEFSGMRFCPTRPEPNVTRTWTDSTVLNDQQIPHSTPWNLWSNELGMFCIMLVFLLLCYVQLCRINKFMRNSTASVWATAVLMRLGKLSQRLQTSPSMPLRLTQLQAIRPPVVATCRSLRPLPELLLATLLATFCLPTACNFCCCCEGQHGVDILGLQVQRLLRQARMNCCLSLGLKLLNQVEAGGEVSSRAPARAGADGCPEWRSNRSSGRFRMREQGSEAGRRHQHQRSRDFFLPAAKPRTESPSRRPPLTPLPSTAVAVSLTTANLHWPDSTMYMKSPVLPCRISSRPGSQRSLHQAITMLRSSSFLSLRRRSQSSPHPSSSSSSPDIGAGQQNALLCK